MKELDHAIPNFATYAINPRVWIDPGSDPTYVFSAWTFVPTMDVDYWKKDHKE